MAIDPERVPEMMLAIRFLESRSGHKLDAKTLANSAMKPFLNSEIERARIAIAAFRECPGLYLDEKEGV